MVQPQVALTAALWETLSRIAQASCSRIPDPEKPWAVKWLLFLATKFWGALLQSNGQYMNQVLPDVEAQFQRGRRTRDQIANICWITEKATEF